MSAPKSPYDILGLRKEATKEEIRIAYRRKAGEVHPDRNPGDPHAQSKLTELNLAFQVLGDEAQRASYDQKNNIARPRPPAGRRGPVRPGPFTGETYSSRRTDFGDPFIRGVDQDGADVEKEIRISFEESVVGGTKKVVMKNGEEIPCPDCGGDGAEPGSVMFPCTSCSGTGYTFYPNQGVRSVACKKCGGRCTIPSRACRACSGSGMGRAEREISVRIPVGIEEGQKLRVAGHGAPGLAGPPGDLILTVRVELDGRFTRSGKDVRTVVRIPFEKAMSGGEVEVRGPGGAVHAVRIGDELRPGETVYVVQGGGVRATASDHGVLHVVFHIDLPRVTTPRAAALIDELIDELRPR